MKYINLQRNGHVFIMALFGVLFSVSAKSQTDIPAQATLLKSSSIHSPAPMSPMYTSYAFYSNVTTFQGSGYKNGGAATQAGNGITKLVADDITLIGTPPMTFDGFTFSVGNFGAAAISARARVRFFQANGAGGGPGSYITGYSFNPISFPAGTIGTYFTTGLAASSVPIPTNNIWMGITFDNNTGGTGATLADLNNLAQGLFDPPDIGSSTDLMFVTTAAGSFNVNNPVGALASAPFAGAPPANFGWEIVPVVPLPIAIEYIHGNKSGNSHNLTWKVNCTNNSQANMTLERSSDSKNYSSIYNITATPVRCQQAFNYTDSHPVGGINYYRLKMEDVDGRITYSSIIAILNRESGFEIISVSPNPVSLTGSAILNVTSAQKGRLQIIVTDATGKKVISQNEELIAGSTQVQINFSKLARGTYQITGYTDDGSSKTVQFVK